MWINFEKKLVYLCNPKCGSSTIRKQLLEQNFIFEGFKIFEKMNVHCNHSPMKFIVKYLELIGEDPDNFTYFTLIREPLKRLISNFKYCKFDVNWHPFYCDNFSEYFGRNWTGRENALIDFSKKCDFTYKGEYNYTVNDYLSFGLEATSNFCTNPLPINKYAEIENKNLHVFKMEDSDKLKEFLKNYDITINFNSNKENIGKYNFNEIISTITKENLEKIYKIYEYEYTHYYKIVNLLHYFEFCKNIKN